MKVSGLIQLCYLNQVMVSWFHGFGFGFSFPSQNLDA